MKKKNVRGTEGKGLKNIGNKITSVVTALAVMATLTASYFVSRSIPQFVRTFVSTSSHIPESADTHVEKDSGTDKHVEKDTGQDKYTEKDSGKDSAISMEDIYEFMDDHPDIVMSVIRTCESMGCCDDTIVYHIVAVAYMYLACIKNGETEERALEYASRYLATLHPKESDKGIESA